MGRDTPIFGRLPMARKQREIPKAKVLSLYEMMERFPDEQAAIDYLTGMLW